VAYRHPERIDPRSTPDAQAALRGIVSDLLKGRYNRGKRSNLFFWKDRSGREVDVLIDAPELIAV
jgi:hypothetical protein